MNTPVTAQPPTMAERPVGGDGAAPSARRAGALGAATALAVLGTLAVVPVVPAAAAAAPTVTGVVRDADGEPLSEALAVAYVKTGPDTWDFWDSDLTRPDGRYTIVAPVGKVRVLFDARDGIHAPEYNGDEYRFDDAPVITTVEAEDDVRNARLAVGGTLTGRVLDPVNGAVDADVTAYPVNDPRMGAYPVTTDANGRYRIGGLPPIPMTLNVQPATPANPDVWYGGWFPYDADRVKPKLGEVTKNLDIAAPRGTVVSGTMTLAGGSSTPNGIFQGWIRNEAGEWDVIATLGFTSGTFTTPPLAPEKMKVLFSLNQAGDWESEFYDDHVRLEDADALTMSPGGTVSGLSVTLQIASSAVPSTWSGLPGSARVGEVLEIDPLDWAPGSDFTVQWYRDDAPVPNATGMSYTLKPGDLGADISVGLEVLHTGYFTVATSGAVGAPIAKGLISPVGSVAILGTPKVGKSLAASPAGWMPKVTFAYQWFRNGAPIAGETGKKLVVTKKDKGKQLSVRVTVKRTAYESVTAFSSAVAIP